MSERLITPNYKKSIVNLMSSIMNYYGVKSSYKTLPGLDKALEKNYKHVVLIVFDGMGTRALEKHLPESCFMMKHMNGSIQSVFPPTTTAAMTTYYTGVAPAEHGWLGWSMYFRDYGAMVDVFTNRNSYNGNEMETKRIAYRELPYKSVYQKLHDVQKENLEIHTIKPEEIYFPSNGNRHHPIRDLDHMKKVIDKVTSKDLKTFTSAYWPNPDFEMHMHGPYDESVKNEIHAINAFIEELCADLSDTLVIVSADHGQIAIEKEVDLNLDHEIKDLLVMPPSIEGRCASFFVKSHCVEKFRTVFEKKYGDAFRLYSHDEVKRIKLFGHGPNHKNFDDYIGDYIAVGIENSLFYYKTIGGNEPHHFKGHHAGMSDEEMLIPLILIPCNPTDE